MEKKKDNSNIAKILGANIKQIRTLEGISQEQLAEKIGKTEIGRASCRERV